MSDKTTPPKYSLGPEELAEATDGWGVEAQVVSAPTPITDGLLAGAEGEGLFDGVPAEGVAQFRRYLQQQELARAPMTDTERFASYEMTDEQRDEQRLAEVERKADLALAQVRALTAALRLLDEALACDNPDDYAGRAIARKGLAAVLAKIEETPDA